MRSRKITIGIMVSMVFCFSLSEAQATIVYNDGEIHTVDIVLNDEVKVLNSPLGKPTILNLVTSGQITMSLYVKDYSQVNMSGGLINRDLDAYNNSQVSIAGGSISYYLRAHDSSKVSISGGSIGDFEAKEYSQVRISGGLIGSYMYAYNNSQVSISGGSIRHHLYAFDSSQITIKGNGFNYPYGTITTDSGFLTGTLSNGDPIGNSFSVKPDARIVLVPGPTILVPHNYATIQDAIDAAWDGDTIIVAPGTYYENINLKGKNITLRSTAPLNSDTIRNTKIDGSVTFRGTEDPNCILTGFNIDGFIIGYDWQIDPNGENHTPATINHCILENIETGCGGVIQACDGIISNCLLANITYGCARPGPVFQIIGCNGLFRNCTMVNMADGIQVLEGGNCTIDSCIIYNSSPIMVPKGATLNISYCNVQGGRDTVVGEGTVNWGLGNISDDPCFIDPDGCDDIAGTDDDNFCLASSSPCIDTGDPNYVPDTNETDLDGKPRRIEKAIDMGAYEYQTTIEVPVGNKLEFKGMVCYPDPDPNYFILRNCTPGTTLNWRISYDCNWLKVSPDSGTLTLPACQEFIEEDIEVNISTSGLNAGIYDCNLLITGDFESNSPKIVAVKLELNKNCFPDASNYAKQYADFCIYARNKTRINDYGLDPKCWCGKYADPPCPYQCDGDTNCDAQVSDYRVYTSDLTVISKNWKKKITDPTLNPCADIDHKGQLVGYRIYTNDLTILANNWKKKSTQLPGNCPRPD